MSKFSGIIDYKPEELYITVKAGTPIKIVKEELKKNNQHLAFEPINFSEIFKKIQTKEQLVELYHVIFWTKKI